MKKIMIAAIAALTGVLVQAATVDWSCFEISSPSSGTGDVSGLLVYFVDSSVTSQSAASAAMLASDFSFLDSAYSAGLSEDGEAYATAGTYGNLVEVTGYAIIFDAATTAAAEHFYITDEASASTGGAGQPASLEFYATSSASASNWTAVPEPTSGLLMLLGMAGLALRRRRN